MWESESDLKRDRANWKDGKSDHLSSCEMNSVERDDKHKIKNFTTLTKFQVSSAQAFKEVLCKYERGGSLGIKQKSVQKSVCILWDVHFNKRGTTYASTKWRLAWNYDILLNFTKHILLCGNTHFWKYNPSVNTCTWIKAGWALWERKERKKTMTCRRYQRLHQPSTNDFNIF